MVYGHQTDHYSILLNRYQFIGRSHLIKWQDGNVVWSDEWTLDFLCCIGASKDTKDQFENEIWQGYRKIQISNVPRDLLFCHIFIWWEYLYLFFESKCIGKNIENLTMDPDIRVCKSLILMNQFGKIQLFLMHKFINKIKILKVKIKKKVPGLGWIEVLMKLLWLPAGSAGSSCRVWKCSKCWLGNLSTLQTHNFERTQHPDIDEKNLKVLHLRYYIFSSK